MTISEACRLAEAYWRAGMPFHLAISTVTVLQPRSASAVGRGPMAPQGKPRDQKPKRLAQVIPGPRGRFGR